MPGIDQGASGRRTAPRRAVERLPDELVDQIAAGEVVERPASVVKELVENALDAGATRVAVEVRGGGRSFIGVTDDGVGMTPEDARRALQRHATSKIVSADDLAGIRTFGFRGEALPAIASVSTLQLRTRARGAAEGTELRVEGGRLTDERVAGGPEGTRVGVADLFRNVPARRKFLKTAATEWGHAADWLARAALALPEVRFELRRDERSALVWPATEKLLDRVAAVLGEELAGALVPVFREQGRAQVGGFVSRPDRHRPTLAGAYLFVNGRPVRDRLLRHALMEVYRDLLPRGRFPSAVLFLDVPPEAVDVNVHPAKWEVRFADPQWVHGLIRNAVRAAVEERRWLGAATPPVAPGGSRAEPRPVSYAPTDRIRPEAGQTDWIFAREGRPGSAEPEAGAPAAGPPRLGELRLLGQLLHTYLVLEGKDALLLVDQHAAHERVLYERLRAEWLERGVESQGLLAPLPLALSPEARAALEAAGPAVGRLGFDVEPFGEDTVALRAVPALLGDRDPATLLRGLADELAAAGPGADALRPGARSLEGAEAIFASLACHAARRKGDVLDPREQRALLDALDAIPWAPTCPHGRPVAVPWDLTEIERRFRRA